MNEFCLSKLIMCSLADCHWVTKYCATLVQATMSLNSSSSFFLLVLSHTTQQQAMISSGRDEIFIHTQFVYDHLFLLVLIQKHLTSLWICQHMAIKRFGRASQRSQVFDLCICFLIPGAMHCDVLISHFL